MRCESSVSARGCKPSRGPDFVILLGIETSCDETAAAVVTDDRRILADVVRGQLEAHRPWGGVVPEVAARAHLEVLDQVIARAMAEAGLGFADLDGIAATGGPGLIGGVIVGVTTAKAIALAETADPDRHGDPKGVRSSAVPNNPPRNATGRDSRALRRSGTNEGDSPYQVPRIEGGACCPGKQAGGRRLEEGRQTGIRTRGARGFVGGQPRVKPKEALASKARRSLEKRPDLSLPTS